MRHLINEVSKIFVIALSFSFLLLSWLSFYFLGFNNGVEFMQASNETITRIKVSPVEKTDKEKPSQTPTPTITKVKKSWGGPELWEEVNKKRQLVYGVNPLIQRDELCTIASIRLNELLEIGKLDGHEGFTKLKEKRPELSWIFERYSTIAEFLAQGGETASETVSMWENTLGHKKLLSGGEFVWGCIYAQNTFAVAIAAY